MTLDEIRALLHRNAALRMPRFTPEMAPRERVDALEDYLNLVAIARAELEEARLCAQGAVQILQEEYDGIIGWDLHLRRRRADPTQAEVHAAKREARPDLVGALDDAKWLVARLGEQIHRLGAMGDDQIASRLYTLITSG